MPLAPLRIGYFRGPTLAQIASVFAVAPPGAVLRSDSIARSMRKPVWRVQQCMTSLAAGGHLERALDQHGVQGWRWTGTVGPEEFAAKAERREAIARAAGARADAARAIVWGDR